MHLKCKHWKRFWRKKRLQRAPEWPSYCNFCKVIQNPHFLKKCKGRTKGNFSKIPKRYPSLKRSISTLAPIALSFNSYALNLQRLEKILAKTAARKVPKQPSYGNFGKVTQNPHFLKKERRGDQGKFFKNRPKSSLRLKGPKALWRKWHYPQTSMFLRCNNWRRF